MLGSGNRTEQRGEVPDPRDETANKQGTIFLEEMAVASRSAGAGRREGTLGNRKSGRTLWRRGLPWGSATSIQTTQEQQMDLQRRKGAGVREQIDQGGCER